jgi:formamidopyrimidine-DNA glycosylase
LPELPDVFILAKCMDKALKNRMISDVKVNQPKVLNQPVESFRRAVVGRAFQGFRQRGKWILTTLSDGWILAFNLGMGGEIRLVDANNVPDPKHERVVFTLDDGEQIWIHFWWFGHVHAFPLGKLEAHPQIGTLGVEPLSEEFNVNKLSLMLEGRRGRIKSYLLDQRFIAGIGNVYVQDILWHARLHPNRKADTLESADILRLHKAIRLVLKQGIKYGPGPGEQDIYGNKGKWGKVEGFPKIGYRTGKECPECGEIIKEVRVGSTTSYICSRCQV